MPAQFDAPGADFLADELAALADRLTRSCVEVHATRGSGGSGVVWSSDGLIVTNAHVVPRDHARVVLHDGREFRAAVERRAPRRDLAALRIEADQLTPAAPGDSGALRVGQLAFAVGNPLGISRALTSGVIHAIGRVGRNDWVQADVRLLPGNSGGPLANANGEVIGINAMIAGGLALAVPSAAVQRFLGTDEATRPALGIHYQPVFVTSPAGAADGLLVMETLAGGRAEAAGVWQGDVIVGIAGTPVGEASAEQLLSRTDPAAPYQLDVLRGGRLIRLYVPVEGRSSAKNAAA